MHDYLTLSPERLKKLRRVVPVLDDPTPTRDSQDDRRRHERVPFQFPMCLTWKDASGQPNAAKARGLNICYGGVSMTVKHELARRQVVSVFIPDPEKGIRRMTARVVFCRPVANIYEAGMQFLRTPDESEDATADNLMVDASTVDEKSESGRFQGAST